MAKKILLADDSLTIQKVVELTFSDSDYELVCVSNGQKALDRVRDDRPDLILADVVMPEKNGYEVCEMIKGDPATARIPVVLLSGTFEPFDRARAERIGADAIVPKPFDSQQLLAQVEALLAKAPPRAAEPPAQPVEMPQTTAAIAIPPVASLRAAQAAPSAAAVAHEEAPFDVGFSAEDFTAAVRLPSPRVGTDPFEEEYGRGDVDSAIEAFEKAHPRFGFGSALDSAAPLADVPLRREEAPPPREEPVGREPQWLRDEPERTPADTSAGPFARLPEEPVVPLDFGSIPISPDAQTIALRRSDFPTVPADQMPTMEFPHFDRRPGANTEDAAAETPRPWLDTAPQGAPAAPVEISALDAHALFDTSAVVASDMPDLSSGNEGADASLALVSSDRIGGSDGSDGSDRSSSLAGQTADYEPEAPILPAGAPHSLSGEIEMLAQRSSIPELTQMLSNVRGSGDGASEMTDEQLDRLASKVVEKLSDRIVREIAWEVIPDMAEIVIKQRIKELESNAE